jgi:hypothetical protein
MNQSATQAATFYRDVAKSQKLWTIYDEAGYPAPLNSDGKRVMPFWSSLDRVEKIIRSVPVYAQFKPEELSWNDFLTRWGPSLIKDGLLVGVNWSGSRAVGYDLMPDVVIGNVQHYIKKRR